MRILPLFDKNALVLILNCRMSAITHIAPAVVSVQSVEPLGQKNCFGHIQRSSITSLKNLLTAKPTAKMNSAILRNDQLGRRTSLKYAEDINAKLFKVAHVYIEPAFDNILIE